MVFLLTNQFSECNVSPQHFKSRTSTGHVSHHFYQPPELSEHCCNERGSELNHQTTYFNQQHFMIIMKIFGPLIGSDAKLNQSRRHPCDCWLHDWRFSYLRQKRQNSWNIFKTVQVQMREIEHACVHLVSFRLQMSRVWNTRSPIVSCCSLKRWLKCWCSGLWELLARRILKQGGLVLSVISCFQRVLWV